MTPGDDRPSDTAGAAERLIAHELELAKLEEQRIQSLENQATAILTVVIAIAAFGASAIDQETLEDHRWWIAPIVFSMVISAGFAVAARGPSPPLCCERLRPGQPRPSD